MNQIGRYQILSEIGRGGMAVVYRARDPNFNRDVAVKVLPRELLHDANFKARFLREAQTIATLEHPAIVPVHDFGEDDGQPYLVMRYMPGGSLADRLRLGPLALPETLRIVGQLAPALDQAHRTGIVHRDLKPANILFDRDENAYIADFGLAKIANTDVNLSATAVYGTPAYMSPEQAKGAKDIDGRADLYALGVVAYQMLAGRVPYAADTPIALALKHVMEPPPRLREARPDLPEQADAVLRRAMAKDPRDRFATASHLHAALAASLQTRPNDLAAAEAHSPSANAPTVPLPGVSSPDALTEAPLVARPPSSVSPAPARATGWWIGCAALVVLGAFGVVALGVGGLLVSRAFGPTPTTTPRPATATVVALVAPSPTANPEPTRTPRPTSAPAMTATIAAVTGAELQGFRIVGKSAVDAQTGSAYVLGYPYAASTLSLVAVDLANHQVLWSSDAGTSSNNPFVAAGSGLLAQVNDSDLTVRDGKTGEVRWRATLSDVVTTCLRPDCLVVVDNRIVVATLDRRLTAFDAETGDIAWSMEFGNDYYGFDLIGDRVVVIDEPDDQPNAIAFIDPASGVVERATTTCNAGSLPDEVSRNAVFALADNSQDLYVTFGFFGTCIARGDLAAPAGAWRAAAVSDNGGLDPWPVIVGPEAVFVDFQGAIQAYERDLSDPRTLLAETDVTYHLVEASDAGLLVVRTRQIGTPTSELWLVDPDTAKPIWTIDLGKSQLLAAVDSFSLDDGSTYVDLVPGQPGQVLMLSYAVGTEAGGASRLRAEQITLADGATQAIAQMPIAAQFTLSRPIRLGQEGDGLWLLVGVGLVKLDLEASEFQTIIQP